MKDFLKDLLWLVVLGIGAGTVYLLLMMLFSWMGMWYHWLIVVAMIFISGSLTGLWGLAGMASAIPFRTIVGVVLACADMLHQMYFSIHAVWTSLPHDDGWGVAINVLATVVYALLYAGIIYVLAISYKARREEKK